MKVFYNSKQVAKSTQIANTKSVLINPILGAIEQHLNDSFLVKYYYWNTKNIYPN